VRLASFIKRIAARLPKRTIDHYGDPYLSRHTLLRLGPLRMYLHRFHRPDADPEHHSHPWPAALAVILTGGYTEERLENGRVSAHERRPGAVHLLRRDTFHRVTHLHGDVWTLFIPIGRNDDAWSFRHPMTGETTPWRAFIERQGRRIA
jgi:hypothetical protein